MEEARWALKEVGVELVWFDSLGAKSACIWFPRYGILLDPGAAAMQPGYPLPSEEKERLRREAISRIEERCWRSKVIVVTHYHYDHHTLPEGGGFRDPLRAYSGLLMIKNVNKYINESQWKRARLFLSQLLKLAGTRIEDYLEEPRDQEFQDPVEELEHALEKSFGDYEPRRRELLEKGRRWFEKLSAMWSRGPWIAEEITVKGVLKVVQGDDLDLEVRSARVKMLGAWFHGVEYDRTGWVTPVLVEHGGRRLLYTSDLMGPMVEDYAYEISRLKPHVLVADGPPTYLFPYMLNKVNLRRAVENMVYILESTESLRLVIYDHHLLREKRWRERVRDVFEASRRVGVPVLTAAECLGVQPLIDRIR